MENQIGHITFSFLMQNESFARELNTDWERYFQRTIEPMADSVLSKFETHSEYIIIDSLNLDLGSIPEESFRDQFPILFKEKLEEALFLSLSQTSSPLARISGSVPNTKAQKVNHPFDLLAYFLLHGTLPWYADVTYKNITFLFREVIRTNGKKLKHFLQTYGHYTSLQERLVYQLNDPELEEGVRLFSPSESTFIVSYIKYLISKYKNITKPGIRETAYRRTVWRVVYAYLLTSRSSYFNKKTFVMSTISDLASSINVTYHDLLDILTDEIERIAESTVITAELYRLLNELKSEATEERFRIIATDAVKLYKTLEGIFRTHITEQLQQADKEALVNILSRPDTCRIFLLQLNEEEIIRLIPVIIPHESKFVISYAHSLDRQKEKGYLAGKAGHEFTKLKWQFIFPLLFENRGSTLNRKHFVYAIIKQIAAHYNLNFTDLLIYFNEEKSLHHFDKQLKEILATLYKEIVEPTANTEIAAIQNTKNVANAGADLRIRAKKNELLNQFSTPNSRRQLLQAYTEEERQQLVRIFFKQESEFILSYATSLEKQEKANRIEGKTGGNFRQLKWEFIWTVLTKDNTTTFNRRYFIANTLKKMAAHYNLGYTELLSYFCAETSSKLFSHEIQTILKTLYLQQIKELLQQTGTTTNETNQQTLLTQLIQFIMQAPLPPLARISGSVPIQSVLNQSVSETTAQSISQTILIYLQFLNTCKKSGLLPNISASTFRTILWKQIINLLLTTKNIIGNFNKQDFLKQLLQQLANYYQLPLSKLITEIQQLKNIPADIQTVLIQILSITHNLQYLQAPLARISRSVLKQQAMPEIPIESTFETVEISNAGIVLLAPWLPRLYTMLGLVEENNFKSEEAQIKAIYLIQYAIFERTDFPEYELTLNKILAGLEINTAVPPTWELTGEEKRITTSMVEGAKSNWPQLKGTSVAALRETFLQRGGRLELKDDHYKLTVEEKAYDLLLDNLPWNFRMIKQSWMQKRIEVKWR